MPTRTDCLEEERRRARQKSLECYIADRQGETRWTRLFTTFDLSRCIEREVHSGSREFPKRGAQQFLDGMQVGSPEDRLRIAQLLVEAIGGSTTKPAEFRPAEFRPVESQAVRR